MPLPYITNENYNKKRRKCYGISNSCYLILLSFLQILWEYRKEKIVSNPLFEMLCVVGDDQQKNMGTKPAHDVRKTLYGRWNDVKTLKRRRNNVVLTSCVGLGMGVYFFLLLFCFLFLWSSLRKSLSPPILSSRHGKQDKRIFD